MSQGCDEHNSIDLGFYKPACAGLPHKKAQEVSRDGEYSCASLMRTILVTTGVSELGSSHPRGPAIVYPNNPELEESAKAVNARARMTANVVMTFTR